MRETEWERDVRTWRGEKVMEHGFFFLGHRRLLFPGSLGLR